MAREVCFQLVDVEGNAGTAVDCVDCADDEADVIDLRDAVKVKYGDSFLADIAASDLRVFKNWAAYDAKQQLQPSSLLTDLGKDEDDALIVQVPKGIWVYSLAKTRHYFYVVAFILLFIFEALGQEPSVKEGRRAVGGLFDLKRSMLLYSGTLHIGIFMNTWFFFLLAKVTANRRGYGDGLFVRSFRLLPG